MDNINDYLARHYIHRSNWLRAAVLGANDGIISISSLAIGVTAADVLRDTILLATMAGLVAGALSMAAGEYVSVSSQADTEQADIAREAQELKDMPDEELKMLADLYIMRGLKNETAWQVATELTKADALGAHIRDELGINNISKAKPLQAALTSGTTFTLGGTFPLAITILAPLEYLEIWLYITTLTCLVILGIISAHAGGSSKWKAVVRITLWGSLSMGISAFMGYILGVNI